MNNVRDFQKQKGVNRNRELNNSVQLRQICHPKETEEFEIITNKEFNKNFELAL